MYKQFNIGVVIRQGARIRGIDPGGTGYAPKDQKTVISRIENHAEDINLSTLDRVTIALGKRLEVSNA